MLKARLSSWADCDIWKDPGVFELNKGYLENLLDRLNLYEYGIMVATRDDATKSRGETKMAPRGQCGIRARGFHGPTRPGPDVFLCSRRIRNYRRTFGNYAAAKRRKTRRRHVCARSRLSISEIATAATFYHIISFIPPGNRLSISEMATAATYFYRVRCHNGFAASAFLKSRRLRHPFTVFVSDLAEFWRLFRADNCICQVLC